jgi:photosystem II stability/assembly factor-like uncharacterized protein
MNTFTRSFFSVAFLFFTLSNFAQVNPSYLQAMKWRMIGPHRGGRTVGAVGIPNQPNVFYIGVNNGGVWKTTDFGRTWKPIFDDQPTGSIGDIAIAPSNPNTIYVGSGEGIQRPDLSVGDGIYKSTDAGKTWQNIGLKDGQQIGGIAIDPTNDNIVFVAVLGHPYGPNTERGVFRTIDGGKTWTRVLYKDENTGAIQVTIDPNNPKIIYADLWAGRQGPWENGAWNGTESGLYKSTDGGDTWKKLVTGLPTVAQGLGRIGFCIAPSNSNRLYATVDAGEKGGIYRSDDAGETWKNMSSDNRYWGRGSDFAEIKADPFNADIVYTANVVAWKSTDGAKTWKDFRGAPGGDDYHRIWINPNNNNIILMASDQGAIITVNGGESFSSWYNQPTAQFYHVSTDNAFPYNVYGGQQESGSVGISSRGNDGQITFREWHPVGVEEYGYVAPDPLNPNIIYGGKITRFDKRTGQVQHISPEVIASGKYRFVRTAPVLFSPIDPTTLFYAGNVLFKTNNGGKSWQVISPDLTRASYSNIPASVGIYTTDEMKKMPRRGVIYTIAPSPKNVNIIWCGTDDGLIQLTKDGGKTWKNVTPPSITEWSKISIMEASHFDENTAYAAVNRIRCDDMKPHIYKTTDGGATWNEIVNGLPSDPINAVKEDPTTKGLLFAGSERMVYFSLNDGMNWQPLRLNMPATSIRDLVIKDDDIVVGTHGRSFWILDNITPLRQLVKNKNLVLFKPQTATRVRWNMNTDTPIPQEEPAGQNPPDGAIIDFYLNKQSNGPISLSIKDASGKIVRKFSSNDQPYPIPPVNIPLYWIRPQQILSNNLGAQRFVWDMHYEPLSNIPSYPIAAIEGNTAPSPSSPWAKPGNYTISLDVDGQTYTQPLLIRMDPRVKTPIKDLDLQHQYSMTCYEKSIEAKKYMEEMASYIANPKINDETKKQLISLAGSAGRRRGGSASLSFGALAGSYEAVMGNLQEADLAPTDIAIQTIKELNASFDALKKNWDALKQKL